MGVQKDEQLASTWRQIWYRSTSLGAKWVFIQYNLKTDIINSLSSLPLVNLLYYLKMQYFWFPSLTNACPTERALLVGSDANHLAAEVTLPLYCNLQPSQLSAGALSLGYHSLSGPLQGTPAVLLTQRRRDVVICHWFPRKACLDHHGSSLVPGLIIMCLGSGLPLGELVTFLS